MTHPGGPSDAMVRIEELAALVALGTASAQEHEEFAGWLDSEEFADEARQALASFEATAACFGESLDPLLPPLGGLEKFLTVAGHGSSGQSSDEVLDANRGEAHGVNQQAASDKQADVVSLSAFRAKRVLITAVVVAVAAAAAFLFLYVRERSRRADAVIAATAAEQASEAIGRDAQTEIETLAQKLAQVRERAQRLAARFEPLRAAKLQLATLSNDSSYAHVLVDDANHWLVVADGLPAISDSKDYQLWFVPPTGKPVSAGLLRPDVDGVMTVTLSVPKSLRGTRLRPAISLEPKGGSTQPTEVKLIGEPI